MIRLVAILLAIPSLLMAAADKKMDVTAGGAVGDGVTLNTKPIQAAIDQLASSGGGTLVIPKGEFLSGALFLKAGVDLQLLEGATLKGSKNFEDYPPLKNARFEGHFQDRVAALLNIEKADHFRLTGPGMIDGNGEFFWKAPSPLGRPRLCAIRDSRDVVVSGVRFRNSPSWNLHFYNCQDSVAASCRFEIADGSSGPSTDGVDIDSCQGILVKECYFSVHDDCVCLKGNRYDGLDQEPKSPPVRDVHVENCTFVRGLGALTLGTEAQSISEVEMKDCVVRGKMPMLRIKLRPDTANQDYHNVRVRNIRLEGGEGEIVSVSPYHGTKVPTPTAPISKVSGIVIENISGRYGSFGSVSGGTTATVNHITFRHVHVTVAKDAALQSTGVADLELEDVLVQQAQAPSFNNGELTNHVRWLDTAGNLINAHDGGIIHANGKYHWYGMALQPKSTKEGGQKTTVGVVMYSSTNLYDWDYEGVILECSTDPQDPLGGPMRFERPKIIYNDRTKTYVMWFHYVQRPGDHTEKPGGGEAGVASASSVNGKYAFRGTVRPIDDRGIVRDSTLFKDDDGSAYFIDDRDIRMAGPEFGRVLHIVKLSDDYLSPTPTFFKIDAAAGREAPVMIKRNGQYFLVTSGLTSWAFNRAKYFRAENISGPYTDMGDPCVGESADTTFNAQGTQAVAVQGKPGEFVFLCERHNTACMTESSFVSLPIFFPTPATLQLRYHPSWKRESWPDKM